LLMLIIVLVLGFSITIMIRSTSMKQMLGIVSFANSSVLTNSFAPAERPVVL
jgi:hypothetical protein